MVKFMPIEKRKEFIINFVYFGILLALTGLAIKYGLAWLSPFVIAFLVAFALKPVINRLHIITKLRRSFTAIICVASFYLVTVLLLSLAGFQIFMLVKNIFYILPQFYAVEVEPELIIFLERLQKAILNIDPGLEAVIDDFIFQFSENIGASVSKLSIGVLTKLSGVIAKAPGMLVKTMITIIASFFIAVDYYDITYFIARQLNLAQRQLLYEVEEYTKSALIKYAKSYSLIVAITFSELFVGLFLLGVKKAWLIALLIAIFDILPILGTGGVLIPWAIVSLFVGDTAFGIGVIMLYLIITVIRNTIEPKIIGKQVGLHPVVTLLAMFIGTKLFGMLGLFLLPVSIAILKQLNDAGKIKLFR
ncbi:MAG: sporulation integral membrane protein YtvI [Oscillospiraceae bacterium]